MHVLESYMSMPGKGCRMTKWHNSEEMADVRTDVPYNVHIAIRAMLYRLCGALSGSPQSWEFVYELLKELQANPIRPKLPTCILWEYSAYVAGVEIRA